MPDLPAGMFRERPEMVIYGLAVDWLLFSVPFALSLSIAVDFIPQASLFINGLIVYGVSFILFLGLALLIRYSVRVASFFFTTPQGTRKILKGQMSLSQTSQEGEDLSATLHRAP
jgi:hypothetical protein